MKLDFSLLSVAFLAGCMKPTPHAESMPTSASAPAPITQATHPPAGTPPTGRAAATAASSGTSAMGVGRVTAVDAAAGTVTIAHGPIQALRSPAMTMPFMATAEQIAGLKVGDAIHFEFVQVDGRARLRKVAPAP